MLKIGLLIWVMLWSAVLGTESSSLWKTYASHAKIVDGLMWEDQLINKKDTFTIGEARDYCKELKLDYFGVIVEGWRLPTVKEFKALRKHYKVLQYTTSTGYWSSSLSKQGKAISYRLSDGREWEAYHPKMPANVRCVRAKIDTYPNSKMSIEKISRFLSMAGEKKEKKNKEIKKPTIPPKVPPMPLYKDEFETSKAYEKRVSAEKERVAKINLVQQKEYREALQKYNDALQKRKKIPLKIKKEVSYLGKAMFIKYGKPLIYSVLYDADKEVFDIKIVSEKTLRKKSKLHKNLLTKEVLLHKGLYTISRIEHTSKKTTEITIKAHRRKYDFYFGAHMGAKVWRIYNKKWESIRDYDTTWSPQKGDILKFTIPRVNMMYYTFGKNKLMLDNVPAFQANYRISVPLKYARKFKELLISKAFDVSLNLMQTDENVTVVGIQGINDPKEWVVEHEFQEVYNSIDGLNTFIDTYKDEDFVDKAIKRKLELESIKDEKEKERIKKAKLREESEAKKREAYNLKKHIGDKVCMEGKMLLFMTVEIAGYVESVKNNKIQIRIADTEGQSPNYNGVTLRQDTIIWDDYYRWKVCE
jgi:hypothetical protein